MKVKSFSRVQLIATPWTAAYQAPPCMAFSKQEYWSGLPLPSPRTVATVLNKTNLATVLNKTNFNLQMYILVEERGKK